MMFGNMMHTRLALRSSAFMLLIVFVVGGVFLSVVITVTQHQEESRQHDRLEELLSTVESTVGIAAFLQDRELAREVASGLMKNATINGVVIEADGEQLATQSKQLEGYVDINATGEHGYEAIEREIRSPFDANEIIGHIVVVPDGREIQSRITQARRWVVLAVSLLATAIAIGTILVVVRLITRPITIISSRLHGLRAETGEKLEFPHGNEQDEIGQLVSDVNALIDYLVNILTDERQLRMQREVEERRFRAIFDNAATGIFQVDREGILVSWNPAFARFADLPRRPEDLRGDGFNLLEAICAKNPGVREVFGQCQFGDSSVNLDFEIQRRNGGGRGRWVDVVLTPMEDGMIQGVVNDITERKYAEEAARKLALTDPLTELGNRLGFEQRLEQMIVEARKDPSAVFAVMLIDLDLFKQVNDTHGHAAGDTVLKYVAQTLREICRMTDYAGRLGGDEFVLLLEGAYEQAKVSPVLNKLFRRVHKPIELENGESARIGASVGIAIFEPQHPDAAHLVHRADLAMYQAKQGGRDTWCFAPPTPPNGQDQDQDQDQEQEQEQEKECEELPTPVLMPPDKVCNFN
ncbi:diguanylate cyclase [Mangrovimicrobium sediminis]|uniref:Diguanylate cyclase n=1 Tax=Mangrovimicrobium sediminis TaxID=2562682 RepID=A0A4Z0M6J3_9GAMM|nr:sensor domain-containing diguanylate cyclase [Haliea sp. SAOS-164]TGD75292.1 diguanylate cyclase [Haliea sp. SAOS-164]